MRFIKPALTYLILPLIIIYLLYLNFDVVNQPIEFDKERQKREKVAIQRLMDIRTLQEEYKKVHNNYAPKIEDLQRFYKEDSMAFVYKSGSEDDSLAMVYTNNVIKKYPRLKGEDLNKKLYELHQKGDSNLVFSVTIMKPVRECLFLEQDRPVFEVDSIAYIPYSGGDSIIMKVDTPNINGYVTPLFEACMPFKKLLKGMDEQLRINLDDERKYHERYEGLKVGDVKVNNLNAGNWESNQ